MNNFSTKLFFENYFQSATKTTDLSNEEKRMRKEWDDRKIKLEEIKIMWEKSLTSKQDFYFKN